MAGHTDKAQTGSNPMNQQDQNTVNNALSILDQHIKAVSFTAESSEKVESYVRLKLEQSEVEVFAVLFLDTAHQLIEYSEMFTGSINSACVYPREVAKKALLLNAAAVIFAHNHPTGNVEPSPEDLSITKQLTSALNLFDISVLDHFIVGKGKVISFAQRRLI